MAGTQPSRPEQDWRARLRGSRSGTLLVLTVTALLVFGGAWVVQRSRGGEAAAPGSVAEAAAMPGAPGAASLSGAGAADGPVIGQAAPDFTARTASGETVTLSSLRGRPVWLTFGGSWCPNCRAEFPDIQATFTKGTPEGLAVVGVFMHEDSATVTGFARRAGLTFTLVPDPATTVASRYRVMGVPMHVFIDRGGVIRSMWPGVITGDSLTQALAGIG